MIFGEHNEHGYLGAPIAKHVIETYFAKKEGRPLPELTPVPAPKPPETDPDTITVVAPCGRRAWRRPLPVAGYRTEVMFERRLYHHIDWGLLAAVLALCVIGVTQIYSATGGWTPIVQTQIYGIVLGLVALVVCLSIDYRSLADKSHFIYIGDRRAAAVRAVLRRRARRVAALDRSRARSTSSRRSSPRRRSRSCWPSSSAKAVAGSSRAST